MAANIWNSAAGYVIIKFEGLCRERFLNRLLQSGIEIWDISWEGTSSMRFSIGVGGFYRLGAIAREYPCRIRILEKHGLMVNLGHMGRRYVMAFGWIMVLGTLIWASRYVWIIDIEGCSSVAEEDALCALKDTGVDVGMRRGSLDTGAAAEAVMASDERIAWAGAQLTGVVLQISVKEAERGMDVHVPGEPCDIYAAQSGIITSVTALSGKPMFREGDAVNAGDVLITGNLGNGVFAEARGSVKAEVLRSFSFFAPRVQTLLRRTGDVHRAVGIELMGRTIFPPEPGYEKYEKGGERRSRLPGILPMTVCSADYYRLEEKTEAAAEPELRGIAIRGAEKRLYDQIPEDGAIISKHTACRLTPEGMQCTIRVVAEENIAKTGDIQPDERTPGN